MQFKDAFSFLLSNNFVAIHKGKPIFTAAALKELSGIEQGFVPTKDIVITPKSEQNNVSLMAMNSYDKFTQSQWDNMFIEFISVCNVPAKQRNNFGDTYSLNKFSKEACKVFKTAILKERIELPVLVISTALYYRSNVQLKKAVGTYFTSGEWRTDYLVVQQKQEDNKLAEHIKENKNGGDNTTGFSRGL